MEWNKIIKKGLIGKGSFGDVFLVENEVGEQAALKIICKEYHHNHIQFRSAFEAARKVSDENCIIMYRWVSDKEVSWLMEYIEGQPISSLKLKEKFELDSILKALLQVCNGLMALHSRNIIHRDLKPENILIDHNNKIKITDFDLIKTGLSTEKAGYFIGTPEYASPEHFISSAELDLRSDLYSLGVIFYELVTGKLPFSGKGPKEIGDQHRLKVFELPTKINPVVTKAVENIISGLLEKDPKDRYQHVHEVASEIYAEIKDKTGVILKEDISYLLNPKFVNRIKPLQMLQGICDELIQGKGKVTLIIGESGVGKTKLLHQFYYYTQLKGIAFYRTACKIVESSFNPLTSIFNEIISGLTEAKKIKYFGQFGWDLIKHGILTYDSWMDQFEKPPALSGKSGEVRLFSAITDFIRSAASKPIMIAFDDLQWADETLLKWLMYAGRNLRGYPVLIIVLHRSEQIFEDSTVLKIPNLVRIEIKNLTETDTSEMIRSMLGKKDSDPDLEKFITNLIDHTRGNPLFVREFLYLLQKKGKIGLSDNRWIFSEDLKIDQLPADIQKVIRERISELNISASHTLQLASIVGRKFDWGMILDLSGKSESELLDDLLECREVALIEETGRDYSFIHDKIREVLEEDLKKQKPGLWRELHQKAGTYLEKRYSDNSETVLDDLADHFYKAENIEKTIKYCDLAGDMAAKNFLNQKALDFYDHFYENLINKAKSIKKRGSEYKILTEGLYEAYFKKAGIYERIGKWDLALENYHESLKLAEELNERHKTARSLGQLGILYRMKGDIEKAMEFHKKQLNISEEIEDEKMKSLAIGNMGVAYFETGHYDKGLDCHRKVLEIYRKLEDKKGIAKALSNISNIYLDQGKYEEAISNNEKSLSISAESNDKIGISITLTNLGLIFFYQGKLDKAMEYLEKSLKINREIGDRRVESEIIKNMGMVNAESGKFGKARICFEQCLNISEELGDLRIISSALGNLGILSAFQGDFDKALDYHNRDLAINEKLNDKCAIAESSGGIGLVYFMKKEYKEALKYLENSIKISKEINYKLNLPLYYYYKTYSNYELSYLEEAQKNLEKCSELAEEMQNKDLIFNCSILKKKIDFGLKQDKENRLEDVIKPLERSLKAEDIKWKKALYHYELAFLYRKLHMSEEMNDHKGKALNLFKEIFKRTPRAEYKIKINALEEI